MAGASTSFPVRAPTAVTVNGLLGTKKHSANGTMGPPGRGVVTFCFAAPFCADPSSG